MGEKIPGGTIEDSAVLKGVMFNKDVTHPKMKRRIENPRILLLDCNLEYKKGESQTNIEIMNEGDFSKILEQEETYIKKICDEIIAFKPDLEITEEDIGTGAGLFEVRKIGDEYFTFIEQCKDPKACTILLRGASKDILNEVERNLQDSLNVARNLYQEPALVPGGDPTDPGTKLRREHNPNAHRSQSQARQRGREDYPGSNFDPNCYTIFTSTIYT